MCCLNKEKEHGLYPEDAIGQGQVPLYLILTLFLWDNYLYLTNEETKTMNIANKSRVLNPMITKPMIFLEDREQNRPLY